MDAPRPVSGTMELLDPNTCEVLDRKEIPNVPTIVSPTVDESRSAGVSMVLMLNERLDEKDLRPPNFAGCIE